MDALEEVAAPRQLPGEPRRRWFTSAMLDLIVWSDAGGRPIGFQLCYGKPHAEHALTWMAEQGFTHTAVDDGEAVGASARVPAELSTFVLERLERHPTNPAT